MSSSGGDGLDRGEHEPVAALASGRQTDATGGGGNMAASSGGSTAGYRPRAGSSGGSSSHRLVSMLRNLEIGPRASFRANRLRRSIRRRALGALHTCTTSTVQLRSEELQFETAPPFAIRFPPATAGRVVHPTLAVADEDGYVTLLDCESAEPMAVKTRFLAHNNAVLDLCWSHDARTIATASGDFSCAHFDVATGTRVATFVGHGQSVKSVSAHPFESNIFASGSRDGVVLVWDTRMNRRATHNGVACIGPRRSLQGAHDSPATPLRPVKRRRKLLQRSVTDTVFLHDGHTLVSSGSTDGSVKFWDLRMVPRHTATPGRRRKAQRAVRVLEPRPSVRGKVSGVSSLALDPSGGMLLVNYTHESLRIYSTSDATSGWSLPLHRPTGVVGSYYVHAAFSPSGQFVVSGSASDDAHVWEIGRGSHPAYTLGGHTLDVTGVAWCPGRIDRLATCSDDGTVRLWSRGRANLETDCNACDSIHRPTPTEAPPSPLVTEDARPPPSASPGPSRMRSSPSGRSSLAPTSAAMGAAGRSSTGGGGGGSGAGSGAGGGAFGAALGAIATPVTVQRQASIRSFVHLAELEVPSASRPAPGTLDSGSAATPLRTPQPSPWRARYNARAGVTTGAGNGPSSTVTPVGSAGSAGAGAGAGAGFGGGHAGGGGGSGSMPGDAGMVGAASGSKPGGTSAGVSASGGGRTRTGLRRLPRKPVHPRVVTLKTTRRGSRGAAASAGAESAATAATKGRGGSAGPAAAAGGAMKRRSAAATAAAGAATPASMAVPASSATGAAAHPPSRHGKRKARDPLRISDFFARQSP